MLEAKKKIRSCEKSVALTGFLVALILTIIWYKVGEYYFAFLIGYTLGFIGFLALGEGFSVLDKMPGWFGMLALMLTSFKLLLLGLIVFLLKLLGLSVVEIIFGLLCSQLAIVFSFFVTLYLDKKPVEEYKRKAQNART